MTESIHDPLSALAALPNDRPPGLLEEMHHGFGLRSGLYRESYHGGEAWCRLDELAAALETADLEEILPLLKARAWEAGSHLAVRLAQKLWPHLSSEARGWFLGGVARHLSGPHWERGNPEMEENRLAEFIAERIPSACFDAQSAAEIAANTIRANQPDLLAAVLEHQHFDPDAIVTRLNSTGGKNYFASQISQHATRSLDVLLECAVRCLQPDAVERLLKLGARPDLPCWNLERSYSEWFSLLSYALHAVSSTRKVEAALRIFDLLLTYGADPRGLPCEGLNHPLKLALSNGQWELADRLLDLGASFSGGRNLLPKDFEKSDRWIPAGHPHFTVRDDHLQWVEEKIAPLMDFLQPWQVPLFYRGDAQGGDSSSFLSSLLAEEHLEQLKHFEKRGLVTRLTPTQFIEIANHGSYATLLHLLRNEPNRARIVFRVRRRKPDFGTAGPQAWLCQPQEDRMNELPEFDPGDQEPLQLPDGSRFYFSIDVVAPPDHRHGPVTGGCFWLEQHHAEHRRRRDRVLARRLKRTWRMNSIPDNDYQINDMIPIVKEVAGRFFLPGISAQDLQFAQHFPESWRPLVETWLEAPLQRAQEHFKQRIMDQTGADLHSS
jgi:hypothetical protein